MKILVVDGQVLAREGVTRVLRGLEPDVHVLEAATAEEACAIAEHEHDLRLVLLDSSLPGTDDESPLVTFRRKHPSIAVVMLSTSTAVRDIVKALQGGAAGFIPRSSSPGIMLGAVRLVLCGGVYLPPELLDAHGVLGEQHVGRLRMRTVAITPQPVHPARLGLSQRQSQVLSFVVQGKTNKEIGRALNLAEATVKAHISAALRALKVTSRTQAVIAVAQLGLDLAPFHSLQSGHHS